MLLLPFSFSDKTERVFIFIQSGESFYDCSGILERGGEGRNLTLREAVFLLNGGKFLKEYSGKMIKRYYQERNIKEKEKKLKTDVEKKEKNKERLFIQYPFYWNRKKEKKQEAKKENITDKIIFIKLQNTDIQKVNQKKRNLEMVTDKQIQKVNRNRKQRADSSKIIDLYEHINSDIYYKRNLFLQRINSGMGFKTRLPIYEKKRRDLLVSNSKKIQQTIQLRQIKQIDQMQQKNILDERKEKKRRTESPIRKKQIEQGEKNEKWEKERLKVEKKQNWHDIYREQAKIKMLFMNEKTNDRRGRNIFRIERKNIDVGTKKNSVFFEKKKKERMSSELYQRTFEILLGGESKKIAEENQAKNQKKMEQYEKRFFLNEKKKELDFEQIWNQMEERLYNAVAASAEGVHY